MDLTEVLDELYGVPLAQFVATRTRLADAAKGDDPRLSQEIARLRKPTAPAWLLNRVVREEPQVVADVVDLGGRMRAAQAKGDGAALAQARPERRAVIDALVTAAAGCAERAGVGFGSAAQDAVAATAVAVLADEDSGRAVCSGHLLRPLSYAGFGEVELDDAVATPLRLVPPLPDAAEDLGDEPDEEAAAARAAREAHEAHEAALEEAREQLREAEREVAAARLAESEARAALVAARDRVADGEARVAAATKEITRLGTRPRR